MIHRSIAAGLQAVDGRNQRGLVSGDFQNTIHLGVESDHTGLIHIAHPIDVGFCCLFCGANLIPFIHAAGDIDYQHGGHRDSLPSQCIPTTSYIH